MRIKTIENHKVVEYIPCFEFVSQMVTSGEGMSFVGDKRMMAYTLERMFEKFRDDIPQIVEKAYEAGITQMNDGIRFELHLDAYRRNI